jgi:hypothetical protein
MTQTDNTDGANLIETFGVSVKCIQMYSNFLAFAAIMQEARFSGSFLVETVRGARIFREDETTVLSCLDA